MEKVRCCGSHSGRGEYPRGCVVACMGTHGIGEVVFRVPMLP